MNKIDLIQLTSELVAIPSVSGEESALADWTTSWFEMVEGETRRIGNNVVHLEPARDELPLVVLAGHLDTVPAQENTEPRIQGDRLIGLGSSDMKSGLAIMLALARQLLPSERRFRLGWVFYDCEEVGFDRNGFRRLWREVDWLSQAELGILLEPTDCTIELGCQGSVQAEFTAPGQAAHSARPWGGKNAVYQALPVLERLAAMEPEAVELGGVVYRETVQVTQAWTRNERNVVPPSFTFNVNYRYSSRWTPEEAVERVRKWLPEDFQLHLFDLSPPAPPYREHRLIEEFVSNSGLEVRAKQGWTDVAQFAQHDVAAINFGPGDPELAHRKDESLQIVNLQRAYDVLRKFLAAR